MCGGKLGAEHALVDFGYRFRTALACSDWYLLEGYSGDFSDPGNAGNPGKTPLC